MAWGHKSPFMMQEIQRGVGERPSERAVSHMCPTRQHFLPGKQCRRTYKGPNWSLGGVLKTLVIWIEHCMGHQKYFIFMTAFLWPLNHFILLWISSFGSFNLDFLTSATCSWCFSQSEMKIYSMPLMDFLVKHKWMYHSARRFFIRVQPYNRLKAVSFY